jgi:diadenosine tetraphosphate (Ap4A) HIT family hydrolase
MIGKALFKIAGLKALGTFIGLAFAYFPFLIPVRKTMVNAKAVAFPHPAASFSDHLLLIPRKVARTVLRLGGGDFIAVIDMAVKLYGGRGEYALLINGGNRQDVMQAHFHLFTGNFAQQKGLAKEKGKPYRHPDEAFWRDFVAGVRDGEGFSILIQFARNVVPFVYLI